MSVTGGRRKWYQIKWFQDYDTPDERKLILKLDLLIVPYVFIVGNLISERLDSVLTSIRPTGPSTSTKQISVRQFTTSCIQLLNPNRQCLRCRHERRSGVQGK